MQNLNRDLLVVTKNSNFNQAQLEKTIVALNKVLFFTEDIQNISIATEVFDLNKYKIIRNPKKVSYYLNMKKDKKFIFYCNKN